MNEHGNSAESVVTDEPGEGEETSGLPIRYTMTSYGADFPVDAIVKRMSPGDICIPEFRRNCVRSHRQASCFIESLLMDLPVPGIFLYKESLEQRHMVVDGQQRLLTIKSFHDGTFNNRRFALVGVPEEFAGKGYGDLSEGDRRLLDDSIVHATIFRQDAPDNGTSSVFAVFERLNTRGTALSPQEIRACLHRGKLNDLLGEPAEDPNWKLLHDSGEERRRDEESILGFLALFCNLEEYELPMKRFPNSFMEKNANPDPDPLLGYSRTFKTTVETTVEVPGRESLRPERSLNASVVDAVLVGLAHGLNEGGISDPGSLKAVHGKLLDRLRDEGLYTEGTTEKDRVGKRMEHAREAFGKVE